MAMLRIRARYEPDQSGAGELLRSPEMQAVVRAAAEAAKPYAQSISPRRSGTYVDSFAVELNPRGGPQGDRAEARLVNTSPYARAVEWSNNGGHRVLGRTVDWIERDYGG